MGSPKSQTTPCIEELTLDWPRAVKRLRQDLDNDFWPDPLAFSDILGSPEDAVERIPRQLMAHTLRQGTCYHIPKGNLVTRESIHLGPLDRIIYQALADRLAPHIDPALLENVYSFRLASADGKYMFKKVSSQWKRFRDAVKEQIRAKPGMFLVVTDVVRYFESIQFQRLRIQLEKMLDAEERALRRELDMLFRHLHEWSPHQKFGLPQNVEASSLLGNAFLDCIDRRMAADGFPILRWMDDIRIVVRSAADGRRALLRLIGYLRNLGLGLNGAKTFIHAPDSPGMREHLEDDDPEIATIEEAIEKKTLAPIEAIIPLLLRKTNALLESVGPYHRWSKFCLNRIISLRRYRNLTVPRGEEITDRVLRFLIHGPEETELLCRYLLVAPLTQKHSEELHRLLVEEPLCVYDWQNFHLWRLVTQKAMGSPALTVRAHEVLNRDPTSPEAAGAALYLGKNGCYSDWEAIAALLPSATHLLPRRCFQVAIQRLHKAARNAAYEALEGDESERLSSYLEGLHEPLFVSDLPEVGLEDLPEMIPSLYA